LIHGHPTYVIDQAWRGRSAADPSAIHAVRSGKAAVDHLPTVFSAGPEGAWAIFRFGKEYPQTMPGMRFRLAAQAEFWNAGRQQPRCRRHPAGLDREARRRGRTMKFINRRYICKP
jgi:hypothetical protein